MNGRNRPRTQSSLWGKKHNGHANGFVQREEGGRNGKCRATALHQSGEAVEVRKVHQRMQAWDLCGKGSAQSRVMPLIPEMGPGGTHSGVEVLVSKAEANLILLRP